MAVDGARGRESGRGLDAPVTRAFWAGLIAEGSIILLRAPVSLRLVVTRGLEGRWMVLRAAEGAQESLEIGCDYSHVKVSRGFSHMIDSRSTRM